MGRFLRYVVHQRIDRDSRRLGLFAAAYHVRREGEMFPYELERLDQWLEWFGRELTVPPYRRIPAQAVFWYVDAGPCAEAMWELAEVLRECGFTAELITARFVGKVVYRDRQQVAAIPPRRGCR